MLFVFQELDSRFQPLRRRFAKGRLLASLAIVVAGASCGRKSYRDDPKPTVTEAVQSGVHT